MEQLATTVFRHDERLPDSLATARIGPLVGASADEFNTKEVAIATRLGGVAVIILMIACANVTSLFMVRSVRRRREIAVRRALGISRLRLMALLLMESLAVSAIAGAMALLAALWAGGALRQLLLPGVRWVDGPINAHVVFFAVGLVLVAGLFAGFIPALQSSRPDLNRSLKSGSRDGGVRRSTVWNSWLAAQVALSVLLLAGAGLFVRSLHSIETEPIGYAADRIVFAEARTDPDHRERERDVTARLPEIARQLKAMPGVEQVALAANMPMYGISFVDYRLPGRDTAGRYSAAGPSVAWVSPEYFDAMGMRVLHGRGLTAQDRGNGAAVVVNEAMARHFWPGQDVVGQCMILEGGGGACTPIVGVVTNAHSFQIVEPVVAQQFFLPLADTQATHGAAQAAGVIVLRAVPGQAGRVAELTRRALREQFAGWAEPSVRRMTQNMERELHPWRTGAALFSAAGILALLVAIVGVYSTISYTFSQRTHEIGVRVALGARASSVVQLVVGEGVRVVGVGIVAGLILALAASRLVESMLYRTSPRDPAVLVVVSITLLLAAVGACLVPAWRALRVDPAIALRAD